LAAISVHSAQNLLRKVQGYKVCTGPRYSGQSERFRHTEEIWSRFLDPMKRTATM
jgi:hypothetical protein